MSQEEPVAEQQAVAQNYSDVIDPKGVKCNHCNSSWKTLTETTKKAHLSNKSFSTRYGIKLCTQVPAAVSLEFTAKLQQVVDS